MIQNIPAMPTFRKSAGFFKCRKLAIISRGTAPPAGLEGLTSTEPCPVEGETACQYGYGQVGLCKSSHWVFQPLCPADQVCDFVPDTTAGCVAGTVCAKCRGLR